MSKDIRNSNEIDITKFFLTFFQPPVGDMQTLQATSYNGVYIWKIPKLTRRRRDAVLGKTISLYSAPFFTSCHGYKLCLRIYLNGDGSGQGTHISFFITLMKGEFDPLLPWSFKQTVSLSLLAQDGVLRDITHSFKPDEDSSSFQMPKSEMNVASGCPQFCSLTVLDNLSYARGDRHHLPQGCCQHPRNQTHHLTATARYAITLLVYMLVCTLWLFCIIFAHYRC